MKAIVVERKGSQGAVRDVPMPTPGAGEILVNIHAAGMNPVDWKLRDVYNHPLPFVLGQDFAGRVVQAGPGVTQYEKGDRVFGIARSHGAYAEYTVVPEDDAAQPIAKIPSTITNAQAAALPTPGLTALACVHRVQQHTGSRKIPVLMPRILIVGVTGSVGRFAAQMAKARGASVFGVGGAGQREISESLGLAGFFAYDESGESDLATVIRTRHPEPFDAVIDLASHAETLEKISSLLTTDGILLSTIGAVDDAAFAGREITAINMVLDQTPESSRQGLTELTSMIIKGQLVIPSTVERPFNEAVEALENLKSGQAHQKLLVRIEGV